MTLLLWVLRIAAVWLGLSLPVAVGIGRAIGRVEQPAPRDWDAEFRALIPGFVTADVFALDAQLNRRARGWAL